MLEILIIAGVMPVAIVLFALVYWLAKRHTADRETDEDEAEEGDPTQSSLPINRCQLAKVRHVIDGDSAVVTTSTQELRIRLGAIDCPENGQHWGDAATLGLMKLIGGRQVAFEGHGVDNFGRTIATVYVRDVDHAGWTDVNAKMIAKGHAWVMRRHFKHLPYTRKTELNRLERWAQRKRLGLWKSHSKVPPWQWRAGNF